MIVNWNGWADIIECLEAVFRLVQFDGPVVICDNGSTDDSIINIRAWTQGRLCAIPETNDPVIRSLIVPPIVKPIDFFEVDEENLKDFNQSNVGTTRLFLLKLSKNVGFAAGNNAALALLRRNFDIEWFWLLNGDTVPARESAIGLSAQMRHATEPTITGSVLLEYWAPDVVQACGASYSPLTGSIKHNLEGFRYNECKELQAENIRVDYPIGASLAVNKLFLDAVGPMTADYFLYHEEIDWVLALGWPSRATITCQSLVFHKGGKTTGATKEAKKRGLTADYYFMRGRILLATRYFPWRLPAIVAVSLIAAVRRFFRPTSGGFKNSMAAIRDGLFQNVGKRK